MVTTPPFDRFPDITFQAGGTVNHTTTHSSVYIGDFILDLGEAMRVQLHALLSRLSPVPLTLVNLAPIERRPGLYQLFLDNHSVYIGKADQDLGRRLLDHYNKIRGRVDPKSTHSDESLIHRMSFRCMYIHKDIDSLGPEKLLISAFRSGPSGSNLIPWNTNGFGNKDVGRERDSSKLDMLHFDRIYPINLSLEITPLSQDRRGKNLSVQSLQDALEVLKASFPFTFRYGQSPVDRQKLREIEVASSDFFDVPRSVQSWFEWLSDRLPSGWVISALSGWVIAYPQDNPYRYHARTNVWWAEGGGHKTEQFDMTSYYKGRVHDAEKSRDGSSTR